MLGSAWVLETFSAALVAVDVEAEVASVEVVVVVEVVGDPVSAAAAIEALLVSPFTEVEVLEVRAVVVEDCIIEDAVVEIAVTLEVSDDCVEVMVLAEG